MQCEGIGSNWVTELQAMCNDAVSDDDFDCRAERFPVNTPQTKEEWLYRDLFEKHFKGTVRSVFLFKVLRTCSKSEHVAIQMNLC